MENKTTLSRVPPEAGLTAGILVDQFDRTFDYFRIALNEACNLRCIYCMPEEGVDFRSKNKIMTTTEILRIIQIAAGLGVKKIRFTGGEPLLNRDVIKLVNGAIHTTGIESVHLTTNGILLGNMAGDLKRAGLHGINISLDTLDRDKFQRITRRDKLSRALEGLTAAKTCGIPSIKINVVALRGFNDDELADFVNLTQDYPLTIRFIELMPFDFRQIWKTGKFFSADHLCQALKKRFPTLIPTDGSWTEYTTYSIPGYLGKVAVIPSYSRNICGNCNRIRLTADGKIRNCLYSHNEFNLRDLMRQGGSDADVADLLKTAMWKKMEDGWAAQKKGAETRESMTQIGG